MTISAPPTRPTLTYGPGQLFQLLRDGQPRTRAEIVEATGLARSTVATRLDTLIQLGLIGPAGEATSSGGRPASRLAFRSEARTILAADLGASHATVALADLGGRILTRHAEVRRAIGKPEATLQWVIDTGKQLLKKANRSSAELAGIGIGVPGPVEFSTGKPNNPPIMPGWDRFDIRGFFARTWDVPVMVDNDVNIMALGERHTYWADVDELLFLKVSTGIGSGIISGGSLRRGADGTSGDIGHVQAPGDHHEPCRCGNSGCLEAVAAGPAIARRLRDLGHPAKTTEDIARLADTGDIDAIHALRQAGRDIGEVLSTCVNLLNPSVIIFGGALASAGDQLLAGARETVYRRSQPLATKNLKIEQSRAGRDAGILGASRLVIDHLLSPAYIEQLAS